MNSVRFISNLRVSADRQGKRTAKGASLRRIATELNANEVRTARGEIWHPTKVRNVILRECVST